MKLHPLFFFFFFTNFYWKEISLPDAEGPSPAAAAAASHTPTTPPPPPPFSGRSLNSVVMETAKMPSAGELRGWEKKSREGHVD